MMNTKMDNEDLKDAEQALEQAIEDLDEAVKWYSRCKAVVNLEKFNLYLYKNGKNIKDTK